MIQCHQGHVVVPVENALKTYNFHGKIYLP